MTATSLEDKIEKIYKEGNNLESIDCQITGMPVKNVEVLITQMIKQHYEWEEIKTIIGIIRKGKWNSLLDIIKDTIN